MARIIKICLIFLLMTGWIYSGWPQIWKNPSFPPKIQEAQANTTGEKYPTLGEGARETPWDDNDWVDSTNIYVDDAATANVIAKQFDDGDQTYVLKATGFDFSTIPDNSTIQGVIVRVNSWYRSGTGSASMNLLQLLDTGKTKVGTNQCATPVALTTTNTTIITKGGSEDLWGNELTAAWIKNASFGVAIGILATGVTPDVDVDYVTIEIHYTPPPAVSISITNDIVAFQTVVLNTTVDNSGDLPEITVDSGPANLNVKSTVFTEGVNTWTLHETNNGPNQVLWEFSKNGTEWAPFIVAGTEYAFDTNVPTSGTRNLYLRLTTPTETDSYDQYSSTVTVVASVP